MFRQNENKIMINIGADVYLELTYKEALKYIEQRESFIQKKLHILNEQIIKNKTYIRLSSNLIDQFRNTLK
jgi:prefoldin subunit 5